RVPPRRPEPGEPGLRPLVGGLGGLGLFGRLGGGDRHTTPSRARSASALEAAPALAKGSGSSAPSVLSKLGTTIPRRSARRRSRASRPRKNKLAKPPGCTISTTNTPSADGNNRQRSGR